jgi:hypothetical protein
VVDSMFLSACIQLCAEQDEQLNMNVAGIFKHLRVVTDLDSV